MTAPADPQSSLCDLPKTREFFVGIDSDGCAFDTMEVKHKECFIPNVVKFFGLAAVSRYARETWEFINLYSRWRGVNRFPGLAMTLDLLGQRAEVAQRGVCIPKLPGLWRWIDRESALSNPSLRAEVSASGDPDLALTFEWSEAVNRSVGEVVRNVPPFPFVRESLERLSGEADVMVVSATPGEALEREWHEHGLKPLVARIAGQEVGSKAEQLGQATGGRYERSKVLMIGDAPGDRKAAEAVGALFYPIDPGAEEASWERLLEEALPRFFAGSYAGPYMDELLARFEALLPERPPWEQA